jgi:hypothetical protein
MAKGQQRSNREHKKPKQLKAKPSAAELSFSTSIAGQSATKKK